MKFLGRKSEIKSFKRSQMNKVLVITYYWPPSGGVGVQRWLKHCKYLPEWGWEPVVLTPLNPAFDLHDPSLQKDVRPETEVLKIPIWEPYQIVEKISGKKGQENMNRGMALEGKKQGALSKMMVWMRGNLLIPDPRMFWVRPAVDFALRIIESNNIKAIITTGPPHSMHLIGRKLKKKTGLPWIADFRDPWTKWEILHRMNLSGLAMGIHEKLERSVLQEADLVFAATPGVKEDLNQLGAVNSKTLLNGVDEEDLPAGYPDNSVPDKFRIVYVGLMNEKRNPECLWQALNELVQEDPEFSKKLEVSLTGNISSSVQNSLKEFSALEGKYKLAAHINHKDVFNLYKKAAVLLLIVEKDVASRVVIPAKLYEYLTAQRPILYIGDPTNGAGEIIRKEKAGESFAHGQKEEVKHHLKELFREYKAGNASRPINYKAYLRRNQTKIVAEGLEGLVKDLGPKTNG